MKRILLCVWMVWAGAGCASSGRVGGGAPPIDGGASPPTGGDGGTGGGGPPVFPSSEDCLAAAVNKSYLGCDYWPTVLPNAVWSLFDFVVAVSNPAGHPTDVMVTGPNGVSQKFTVMPRAVQKIYLPWVPELKGPDSDPKGNLEHARASMGSVRKDGGAYHLVSAHPVFVYQFNALEYRPVGGPAGKDWSSCPAFGQACYSYSNDASLLLPSTAMTGHYRVVTGRGTNGYFAIVATRDGTAVKVKVAPTSSVLGGAGVSAIPPGGKATLSMNAGDVAVFAGENQEASDLSGSLVEADQPVQVIGGMLCHANIANACDHIEETVAPTETWGRKFLVTVPTAPRGHRDLPSDPEGPPVPAWAITVRMVGNVNGTKLTYSPAVGGPSTLDAGQVVELPLLNRDFLVQGDHEFHVSTIQLSGSSVDSDAFPMALGDPSLSAVIALEQYRPQSLFLAPDDYERSYADIVAPTAAKVILDGVVLGAIGTPVGTSGMSVYRVKLGPGNAGVHVLESDMPVGLQVIGYGLYTSYQYPGGLDLRIIAPPPPPIG